MKEVERSNFLFEFLFETSIINNAFFNSIIFILIQEYSSITLFNAKLICYLFFFIKKIFRNVDNDLDTFSIFAKIKSKN